MNQPSLSKIEKYSKPINKTSKILYSFFRIFILLAIGYIIIYPLIQMIVTAIKDKNAFFDAARVWLPSGYNIKFNFSMAVDAIDYWDGLKSTLLYQIVSALIEVFTCSIAAYGFSRFKFKFR